MVSAVGWESRCLLVDLDFAVLVLVVPALVEGGDFFAVEWDEAEVVVRLSAERAFFFFCSLEVAVVLSLGDAKLLGGGTSAASSEPCRNTRRIVLQPFNLPLTFTNGLIFTLSCRGVLWSLTRAQRNHMRYIRAVFVLNRWPPSTWLKGSRPFTILLVPN